MNSLKDAKFNDYWRRTFRRSYPFFPKSIVFNGEGIFGGLELSLNEGINAIVGKNGTGKSNFIRSLFNSFSSEVSNRKKFTNLLDDGGLDVRIVEAGVEKNVNFDPSDFDSSYDDALGLIFDPCSLIPEIQKLLSTQKNFEELVEGFGFSKVSDEDLKLVNYLTNNFYQKVEVANIEDEYEDFPVLPFFQVEQAGVKYDSRDMGLGELSVFYFYWLLNHSERAEKNCLLFVEEPESFLPPLIQRRLCNVLAMIAAKGVSIIISTHSEHILENIPPSHIHIMRKVGGAIKFYSASENIRKMEFLGVKVAKKGLILHEDRAAKLFIESLIKFSNKLSLNRFYFHNSGSESEVVKTFESLPKDLDGFSIIAILDGDSRPRYGDKLEGKYVFLPGELSPEEMVIEYSVKVDIGLLSTKLSKSPDDIHEALDVVSGLDHHDFFHEFSRVLEEPYEKVFSILCDMWVEDNLIERQDFLEKMERIVA